MLIYTIISSSYRDHHSWLRFIGHSSITCRWEPVSGVDHLFLCCRKVQWTDFHHSFHLQSVQDLKPAGCWGIRPILSRKGGGKVWNDHMTSEKKRFYTEASDNSRVAFWFKWKIISQKPFSWPHWPYFPGLTPMLAPAPPASVLNLFTYTWKSWNVQCLWWVTHHIFLGRSVDGGFYQNLNRSDRTVEASENDNNEK